MTLYIVGPSLTGSKYLQMGVVPDQLKFGNQNAVIVKHKPGFFTPRHRSLISFAGPGRLSATDNSQLSNILFYT